MELNWKEDVEINPEALDVEWVRQPRTFMQYAREAAKARDALDRAKEAHEVVRAEVSLDVRKNPGKYNLEKVTEGSIESVLLLNEQCKEASDKLATARYEAEITSSAVRAMDMKKSALENLVRLHGQSYFAGPSVPRDIGAEWAKDSERNEAKKKVKEAVVASRRIVGRGN